MVIIVVIVINVVVTADPLEVLFPSCQMSPPDVHILVINQLISACECRWTDGALEGFHAVVNALMSHQIRAGDESPWTLCTDEGFQSCVDPHVLREVRVAGETLLADLARVRPDARVNDRVLSEIGAASKSLFAFRAEERFLHSVLISQVLLQNDPLVGGEEAVGAVVREGGVVFGQFVFRAVLLEFEAQVAELTEEERLLFG